MRRGSSAATHRGDEVLEERAVERMARRIAPREVATERRCRQQRTAGDDDRDVRREPIHETQPALCWLCPAPPRIRRNHCVRTPALPARSYEAKVKIGETG